MPEIEIDPDRDYTKGPEELMKLMGQVAYEYASARARLKALRKQYAYCVARTSLILSSRSTQYIKNEKLRGHLDVCFNDPKFRLTNELIHNFSYLEHRELFEEYEYCEEVAKNAQKEHEMLTNQLMHYHSENKLKGAELMNKL
jgi:hypothetical protein